MLVKLCSVQKSIITDRLIQVKKLTKSLVKHCFSLHNLLRTYERYVHKVMYSRLYVGFNRYFDF